MFKTFRLIGDATHLFAILLLFVKLVRTRSCADVSGKSQILFLIVYLARYMDLVTTYISLYNTLMKLIFITSSMIILFLIFVKYRKTYDRDNDTFKIEYLLIPACVIALIVNNEFAPLEVLWTFSIYLEAVAILPQFYLIQKIAETDKMIIVYLCALCIYRMLYFINWILRYMEQLNYDLISTISGAIQIMFYCVFFVHITLRKKPVLPSINEKMKISILENIEYPDKLIKRNSCYPEEKIHKPVQWNGTNTENNALLENVHVSKLITEIVLTEDDDRKIEMLDTIALIGRTSDLSSVDNIAQYIFECFDAKSQHVQEAASYALGNVAAGNLCYYLPYILKEIEAQPKRQYLLFISLKVAIAILSKPSPDEHLLRSVPLIWSKLLTFCEYSDQQTSNIIAECLGKLLLVSPNNLLESLKQTLHSESLLTKTIAISAIKFTISPQPHPIDDLLKRYIGEFVFVLKDPEPIVRETALETFDLFVRVKPDLVPDMLSMLLPSLELGLNHVDITEFLDKVQAGDCDKIIYCSIVEKLAILYPDIMLLKLNEFIPMLRTIQEEAASNNQNELKQSLHKAISALMTIPNANENEEFEKLYKTS